MGVCQCGNAAKGWHVCERWCDRERESLCLLQNWFLLINSALLMHSPEAQNSHKHLESVAVALFNNRELEISGVTGSRVLAASTASRSSVVWFLFCRSCVRQELSFPGFILWSMFNEGLFCRHFTRLKWYYSRLCSCTSVINISNLLIKENNFLLVVTLFPHLLYR